MSRKSWRLMSPDEVRAKADRIVQENAFGGSAAIKRALQKAFPRAAQPDMHDGGFGECLAYDGQVLTANGKVVKLQFVI